MLERLLQVWASFRLRQGFPSHDRVSSPMSRYWFPVSQHGSQVVGSASSQHSFFMSR